MSSPPVPSCRAGCAVCAHLTPKLSVDPNPATQEIVVTLKGQACRFVIAAWCTGQSKAQNGDSCSTPVKAIYPTKEAAPDCAEPLTGGAKISKKQSKHASGAVRMTLSPLPLHKLMCIRAHANTGATTRLPRAAPNSWWAPTNEEASEAELLLYALLIVLANPRNSDREDWLSFLLADADRAAEKQGSWEEKSTVRWLARNRVSSIDAVLEHAIDTGISDDTARDKIAAAMRTWKGLGTCSGARTRMRIGCPHLCSTTYMLFPPVLHRHC
mmetsp:Transcript_2817/g.5872  ORF Transcript_2817/g.5872 Transcript_2817/m.5872 type:complete len:270 (+) Transcript_2817:120-929(+)